MSKKVELKRVITKLNDLLDTSHEVELKRVPTKEKDLLDTGLFCVDDGNYAITADRDLDSCSYDFGLSFLKFSRFIRKTSNGLLIGPHPSKLFQSGIPKTQKCDNVETLKLGCGP
ncbi:Uncharacterized protein Fot_13902 [Forsythia ovata]|uniref:DUF5615 domain-containing protein n=1 Tax=Forsythia ovata TaxID=205694 RepID=A0ABD1W4T4_9LAMI